MVEHQELTSFITDNGFIWGPSPEIYGGVAGFYDYGPLGKLLKNNVETTIRRVFTRHNFWEVECPTVMPAIVWKASGHLGGFTDPLIACSKCNAEFRVDKLIEEKNPHIKAGGLAHEHALALIAELKIVCGSCKGQLKREIIAHSLMMRTTIGSSLEAYNRPETATTTYLPFKRYTEFFRRKLPYGVFQIGKAYRNEISPRQGVLRGREFTQAEGQLFLFEDQKAHYAKFEDVKAMKLPLFSHTMESVQEITLHDAMKKHWLKNKAYAWTLHLAFELFLEMGIPRDKMRLRQHSKEELAFYADDAWDIEINLPSYSWYEVCGVHDRKDSDLVKHAKESKQKLEAYNEEKKRNEIPHILEIAFGTDRPTFALLDLFFDGTDTKHLVLRIPPSLAPVKVGVFSLVNKLNEDAKNVYDLLKDDFVCQYDTSGSIGRRYARADEIGIPVCVTVDFDSLQDKAVTLRRRDDGKQTRVKISLLHEEIKKCMDGDWRRFDA